MGKKSPPIEDSEGQFCIHVRPFVGRLTDGTLPLFLRWFIDLHISKCRSCQKALAAFRQMGERLRQLRDTFPTGSAETLTGNRWAALESSWAETKRRRGK